MGTFSKASWDGCALAMMSETYFFELRNPLHPLLKTIGNCRVVGVVINETALPELLIHPEGQDTPEFHSIDELIFPSALSVAV